MRLYFVIVVMGLLSLHSMLSFSRRLDLGDESAYHVRGRVLSLLAFVVKDELSELQEIVRWDSS